MEMNIDSQRLEKINKGFNFINLNKNCGKKYYLKIFLKVEQNLKDKKESIDVETNLPVKNTWSYTYNFDDFMKDLKEFVKLPLVKINIPNMSSIGYYELRDIEKQTRKEEIRFNDIDISIGELAEKRISKNFKNEIKEILNLQKEGDKEIQNKLDRYVYLVEDISFLKRRLCNRKESYCSYNKKEDDTIKLPISIEEYNIKLKEIEQELRVLEKEFGMSERRLDYVEVAEKKSYETWFKEHEEELKENFENKEDEDDGMTFDEYAEMCFAEFGDEDTE